MPDRSTKLKANILDDLISVINPATEEKQDTIITRLNDVKSELQVLNSLIPSVYNHGELIYGQGGGSELNNLIQVIFKNGGTVVSTITLNYNGDNDLISFDKT